MDKRKPRVIAVSWGERALIEVTPILVITRGLGCGVRLHFAKEARAGARWPDCPLVTKRSAALVAFDFLTGYSTVYIQRRWLRHVILL